MSDYLLDTNIVSHLMRGDIPQIDANLLARKAFSDFHISSISIAEIEYGLEKLGRPPKMTFAFEAVLQKLAIVNFEFESAKCFAQLRSKYERIGVSISAFDLLIAASAMQNDFVLVTRDKALLQLKDTIKIETWT